MQVYRLYRRDRADWTKWEFIATIRASSAREAIRRYNANRYLEYSQLAERAEVSD